MNSKPIRTTVIMICLAGLSIPSLVYPDSTGMNNPVSRSEACPISTKESRQLLAEFIFDHDAQPRWMDPKYGDTLPALSEVKGAGHIKKLRSPKDDGVCSFLAAEYSELMNRTYEGEPGDPDAYYIYEAGFYAVGKYYVAVFKSNPPPQPDGAIRVALRYQPVYFYDRDLNFIVGYDL